MKQLIFLIISLFTLNCTAQQSFIDLRGDSVSLGQKKTIAILFSSISCHQCYIQLAELLNTINIDTSKVSIVAIANVDKNTTDIAQRKSKFNYIQSYLPFLSKQEVYFNTFFKGKNFRLFGKKMDERIFPSLFLIENNEVKSYIKSLYYKNEENISKSVIDTIMQFINKP